MEKNPYDKPEDKDTVMGRALILLAGAILMIIIGIAVYTGNTPIG